MLEETATVVALAGAYVQVEIERGSACGACSARSGCGTSLLARLLSRRRPQLRALNPIGAAPGDKIVIGMPEQGLVGASFAAYLVPLVGLLAGAVAGKRLGGSELAAILGATLGLAAGFAWVARFAGRHRGDLAYQAVVLRPVTSSTQWIRFSEHAEPPRAPTSA